MSTPDRVKFCEDVLALIDRRRAEMGDPLLGSSIEKAIFDNQIRELEKDILDDPGAFEPWLIRGRSD